MTTMALPASEKFRIGRVFGDTFSVIGRNFLLFLGLAVLFSALPALLYQFLVLGGTADLAAAQDPSLIFADGRWVWLVLAGLLWFGLSLVLQAALVRGTIEDLSGKRPSFGDCVGTAIGLLLPVLGLSILIWLGLTLGLLLLVIPGIILLLRWFVAVPVLVQERAGVLGSMRRSAHLTKGSRWAILGLLVLVILVSFAAQTVFGVAAIALGPMLGGILANVGNAALAMFAAASSAVAYVELRRNKEGTSVEQLAEIFS